MQSRAFGQHCSPVGQLSGHVPPQPSGLLQSPEPHCGVQQPPLMHTWPGPQLQLRVPPQPSLRVLPHFPLKSAQVLQQFELVAVQVPPHPSPVPHVLPEHEGAQQVPPLHTCPVEQLQVMLPPQVSARVPH